MQFIRLIRSRCEQISLCVCSSVLSYSHADTHDRHKSPFFYDPAHKLCHMPGLASDEMLLVALLTSASPCLMFPVCYISHISLTASNLRPLKLNNHRAKAKIQMEILQEKKSLLGKFIPRQKITADPFCFIEQASNGILCFSSFLLKFLSK